MNTSRSTTPTVTRAGLDERNESKDKLPPSSPPKLSFRSLWERPIINPVNGKSTTLPMFNLSTPYGRNFHLSWLGFFVAFLSWFAFAPLMPEAIKSDLNLSNDEVANSNIISLIATLLVRVGTGPLVDRFGPRLVMAAILVVGAIPSGLAGTANSAGGLYAVRFFIGILGGSFVPCQAWTSAFFDTNIVGTANSFVGGWGTAGGGATYAIMGALYDRVGHIICSGGWNFESHNNLAIASQLNDSLPAHKAWRVAFVAIPVPVLLLLAVLVVLFGTDHPAGKWRDRHTFAAAATTRTTASQQVNDSDTEKLSKGAEDKESGQTVLVQEVSAGDRDTHRPSQPDDQLNAVTLAVNQPLTKDAAATILLSPLTWLPALAYVTTLGFELAVNNVLASAFIRSHPDLGQRDAGYLAAVFGLMNIVARPCGGLISDSLFKRFGVKAKKWFLLFLGTIRGAFTVGFGYYLRTQEQPSLGAMMAFTVLQAVANEAANGANFSLVPHCNPAYNGVMSGIVGGCGNLGGIIHALIFRFQSERGTPWIISGFFALGINICLSVLPAPPA